MIPRTISLGHDGRHCALFTTLELLEAEQRMIQQAKALRQRKCFGVPVDTAVQAMNDKPFSLNEEQQQAVLDACQANHLAILQGSAGAGKSTSMDCVRAAYEATGYEVMGACVSKAAADNLAMEAQLTTHTPSHRLMIDIERGHITPSQQFCANCG